VWCGGLLGCVCRKGVDAWWGTQRLRVLQLLRLGLRLDNAWGGVELLRLRRAWYGSRHGESYRIHSLRDGIV